MLVDLLATDNYTSYNIKIAKAFGLEPAVYLSEVINITNKATIKQKLLKDFVMLDRNYITSRTTLSTAAQLAIDKKLSEIEIIKISDTDPNLIHVDIETLAKLITSADLELLGDASKLARIKIKGAAVNKASQRRSTIETLKQTISHPNEELTSAYKDWIEGVYANPNGFLSKKAIEVFMAEIDDYAKGDLDLALKLVEIATINGYRCAAWAIKLFESDYAEAFKRMYQNPEDKGKAIIPDKKAVELGDEIF